MITDKQRKLRVRYLGSSDAPAVVGLSPFAGPADVYWDKISPRTDDEPTDSMAVGNLLEQPIMEWAAGRLRKDLSRRNTFRVKEFRCANVDGWIDTAIESKFVSAAMADEWGQDGTDEIPDHVMVQVHHQMEVCELDHVWVAAAIARFSLELRLYHIQRDESLITNLLEQEREFWEEHVCKEIPPDPVPPPMRVLTSRVRIDNRIAQIDPQLVAEWMRTKEAEKSAKDAAELAKRAVLDAMGECPIGEYGDSDQQLVFRTQKSPPRYDADAMRADGVWEKYASQGTHGVLATRKRPKQ